MNFDSDHSKGTLTTSEISNWIQPIANPKCNSSISLTGISMLNHFIFRLTKIRQHSARVGDKSSNSVLVTEIESQEQTDQQRCFSLFMHDLLHKYICIKCHNTLSFN